MGAIDPNLSPKGAGMGKIIYRAGLVSRPFVYVGK